MTEILSFEDNPEEYVLGVSAFLEGCESPKDLFVTNKDESTGKFKCPILNEEVELSGGTCKNHACKQNHWYTF